MTYDKVQGDFDEILDVVQFPHLLEVLTSAEALIPQLGDVFARSPASRPQG